MKFLGMNLIPLTINQLPDTWIADNTLQESAIYFFSGEIPANIDTLVEDLASLYSQADAAIMVPFRLLKQGYVPILDMIRSYKPVSGSKYFPSLNAVLHFPKAARVMSQTKVITDNTVESLPQDQKNRIMHGLSVGPENWPGLPLDRNVSCAEYHIKLVYDQPIAADGMMSLNYGTDISGTLAYDVEVEVPGELPEDPPTYTTERETQPFTIPLGLKTFLYGQALPSSAEFDLVQSAADRTAFLVTAGGSVEDNVDHSVTLTHAIVLTRTRNEAVRYFLCDVGTDGSGAYIQLEKTVLTTGERPEIIRTLTGTGA